MWVGRAGDKTVERWTGIWASANRLFAELLGFPFVGDSSESSSGPLKARQPFSLFRYWQGRAIEPASPIRGDLGSASPFPGRVI